MISESIHSSYQGNFSSCNLSGNSQNHINKDSYLEEKEKYKLSSSEEISMSDAILQVLKNYVPSSLTTYIEYSITFLNIVFISMLDDPVMLSGWGLGIFMITNTMNTWNMGLCGAIDTLASQAFGRKDYKLCATYLNTARILFTILLIPQTLFLFHTERILLLFGQPEDSAKVAQKYVYCTLIGAFLNMQFEATRRFLITQRVFNPTLYTLIASTIFHAWGLSITVLYLGWEIYGKFSRFLKYRSWNSDSLYFQSKLLDN